MKKLLALAAICILALTGCSGAGASSAGGRAPADAGGDYSLPEAMPDEAKPTAAASGSADLAPQIARTAQVAVRVPDLLPAVEKLRVLAASHQGQVTNEQLSLDEGGSATSSSVVLQVAAGQLDAALNEIGGLGQVLSRRVTAEDVTTQVADIDARLRNLDASIARLTKLMDHAGNLADLSSIEEQLTARQGERDSLAAQQKALAGRVALSTITVALETPGQVVTQTTPGFLGGLQAGWDGLIKTLAVTVTMIGVLLPFAAVIAVIVVPFVWWRRRRNRSRLAGPTRVPRPAAPQATTAAPAPAPAASDSAQPAPKEHLEGQAEDQH